MKTGAELIAEERKRQIEKEGFDSKHDANDAAHGAGELSMVAEAYVRTASIQVSDDFYGLGRPEGEHDGLPEDWPSSWDKAWWKPSDDPIRNLIKAGALIAAEIDRIQGWIPAVGKHLDKQNIQGQP